MTVNSGCNQMQRMGVGRKSAAGKHDSDDDGDGAPRAGRGGAAMSIMKEGKHDSDDDGGPRARRGDAAMSIMKGVMLQLGRWLRNERGACRIVNETGREVVVRPKYRDVWEGQQWRLPAQGGYMVVPSRFLAHGGQPFYRLAAFLVTEPPFSPPPLFITCIHLLHHRQLALSLSLSAPSSIFIRPVTSA